MNTEQTPFLSLAANQENFHLLEQGKVLGTAQGMVAAPRLLELQEHLDNTPGHRVGFLGWPGARLSDSCGHIPAQEIQWYWEQTQG